jgi:hypothetical protein
MMTIRRRQRPQRSGRRVGLLKGPRLETEEAGAKPALCRLRVLPSVIYPNVPSLACLAEPWLTEALSRRPYLARPGAPYLLIGRTTFSAAMTSAVEFKI